MIGNNDPDGGDFLTPSSVSFVQAIPGSANTDGSYMLDAEGTGLSPRCDAPGVGNGFQCTARLDDPDTEDCDEADGDGDFTLGDLAFALHASPVTRRTKALPPGIAAGSWSVDDIEPAWNQPRDIDGDLPPFFTTDSDENFGGGTGSRFADNFTAFEAMAIEQISWWGFYRSQWDAPSVPDKFTIRFYKDLNGIPGQLRIGLVVDPTKLTRERVELTGIPGTTAMWKYTLDLTQAFVGDATQNIVANDTEWISVTNDSAATEDYTWVWARGAGGDGDNRSAQLAPIDEDGTTPWEPFGADMAFQLSEGASVYAVDVVDDMLAVHLDAVDGGQGLAYIHGTVGEALLENGDPNPEADAIRWNFVSAPLKMYNVYDAGNVLASDLVGGAGVLGAGMAEISQQDLDNILGQEGSPGPDAVVTAVFRGLADYAVNTDENGTERHGRIDFLCDRGIAYFIDPAQVGRIAGPQALEVKGLMFADGARGTTGSGSAAGLFKPRNLIVLSPDSGQRSLGRDCQPGDQIECDGAMIDCPVDGTCPVPLGGVPCDTNEDCATSEDATFCTFDSCVDGSCEFLAGKFGDVVGAGGVCGPDNDVALNDILAVLDGFAGTFRDPCTKGNIDIGGSQGSCQPDDDIALADILHVLDAFAGTSPCTAICANGGPAIEPPAPRRLANGRPSSSAAASFTLVTSDRSVAAGGEFSVDVYVSGATGLRGYEVSLAATGGRRGSLELVDVAIRSERSDFALNGSASVVTDDLTRGRVAAALYQGETVDSGDNAYLGTFTFRASDDAAGAFDLSIETGGTSLVDAIHRDIPSTPDASTAIRVGSDRSQRSKASRRR